MTFLGAGTGMPRGSDADFVKTRAQGYEFERAACKSPTVIRGILSLRYNWDEEVHLLFLHAQRSLLLFSFDYLGEKGPSF